MSQEKLAELADLHPTYISEIERGRVNASVYSIFLITNVLGMELADVLNLQSSNLDRLFENELADISGKIRRLEASRRELLLNGLKGMLKGLET